MKRHSNLKLDQAAPEKKFKLKKKIVSSSMAKFPHELKAAVQISVSKSGKSKSTFALQMSESVGKWGVSKNWDTSNRTYNFKNPSKIIQTYLVNIQSLQY